MTIDLVAKDVGYNLDTITVLAGAQVTINFSNEDAGVPHNLDIVFGVIRSPAGKL